VHYIRHQCFINQIFTSDFKVEGYLHVLTKNTILSEQFQKSHAVWTVPNCSDSMIFWLFRQYCIFGTVQTVWYFWNCSDSMVFLELFRQYDILIDQPLWYFWNCSDSVVFFSKDFIIIQHFTFLTLRIPDVHYIRHQCFINQIFLLSFNILFENKN
jgi:hypothetical protein